MLEYFKENTGLNIINGVIFNTGMEVIFKGCWQCLHLNQKNSTFYLPGIILLSHRYQ